MIKRFCDKCGIECSEVWFSIELRKYNKGKLDNWADAFVCRECSKLYLASLGSVTWQFETKDEEKSNV